MRPRTRGAHIEAMTQTTIIPSPPPVTEHRRRRSVPRRFFGVVAEAESYRNLAYLLLGLPLGTAWFTVLVTGISVGVSLLAVALVGLPILFGLWYVVRACANVERSVANGLLGQHLAHAPLHGRETGNLWRRLRSMTNDRDRRRELSFLALRFPVGLVTFTTAVTLFTTAVTLVYAPVYARVVDHPSFGSWSGSPRVRDIASSSPWSWLLVPLGALAVIASCHITNAIARASGRWAATALG